MTMGHRIAVLRDGVMQQLDTPQTLYDRPANLFVAGFIGTPAMNFFPGQLVSDNGGQDLYVQSTGLKLKLADALRTKMAAHSGREVVFGVRPEHIHNKAEIREAALPGSSASAKVAVIEPLGSEVFAYLSVDGHEFISRMDASTAPRAGDTVEVFFETQRMHIFDKETETSLSA
jgi:multiple sugar transport system ATP-binding protein